MSAKSRARKRRVEELAHIMLRMAARDSFGGVGRVLTPELEAEGYSYDEIIEAVSLLRKMGRRITIVGDIIKIENAKP